MVTKIIYIYASISIWVDIATAHKAVLLTDLKFLSIWYGMISHLVDILLITDEKLLCVY